MLFCVLPAAVAHSALYPESLYGGLLGWFASHAVAVRVGLVALRPDGLVWFGAGSSFSVLHLLDASDAPLASSGLGGCLLCLLSAAALASSDWGGFMLRLPPACARGRLFPAAASLALLRCSVALRSLQLPRCLRCCCALPAAALLALLLPSSSCRVACAAAALFQLPRCLRCCAALLPCEASCCRVACAAASSSAAKGGCSAQTGHKRWPLCPKKGWVLFPALFRNLKTEPPSSGPAGCFCQAFRLSRQARQSSSVVPCVIFCCSNVSFCYALKLERLLDSCFPTHDWLMKTGELLILSPDCWNRTAIILLLACGVLYK